VDRDLHGLDPLPPQREREHLGVVVVVRHASLRERARRERPVASLAVARDRLHEEAQRGAREPVREVAVPAHAVAAAEEARAEDVVGAPARHRLEDARQVRRVVLAVAVDVDGHRVALVAGDLESGAKSGAEAPAVRMRDDPGAELPPDVRRRVARAVVDEQDVDRKPPGLRGQPREHTADGGLLVTGDDDRKTPPARRPPRSRRILCRHQRAAAGGLRRGDSEQRGDRVGDL